MIQVNCSDYCDGNGLCVKNTRTTDTELTRLKRQVEVLREAMHSLAHDEFAAVGFRMDVARKALAAADRIAKGEVDGEKCLPWHIGATP